MDGMLLDFSHIDSFQKWAVVCAVVLTLLYLTMRPMRKRKDPLAHASQPSLAGQREVEKLMTELLVELEQMARQMTAQLDTRAAKLEVLIREADEKIAQLQGNPGPQLVPSTRRQTPPVAMALPDPGHVEVYGLADQGRSSRQIAQELNRPYGEVELILALRGHRKAEVA